MDLANPPGSLCVPVVIVYDFCFCILLCRGLLMAPESLAHGEGVLSLLLLLGAGMASQTSCTQQRGCMGFLGPDLKKLAASNFFSLGTLAVGEASGHMRSPIPLTRHMGGSPGQLRGAAAWRDTRPASDGAVSPSPAARRAVRISQVIPAPGPPRCNTWKAPRKKCPAEPVHL